MSGGVATNAYLFGGTDGTPVNVGPAGNAGSQLYYTIVGNIGRVLLRTSHATRLNDIPCSMLMVFNPATNGNVWYAGYDTMAPQVGVGIPLLPGTSSNLPCTDANFYSFIPETDGNCIYVLALMSGSTDVITPGNPDPLDVTPPTIVSTNPLASATGVSLTSPIIATASEALDPGTVNNTTVTASPTMAATISLDSANPNIIIILPNSPYLTASQAYTITYNNFADLSGNIQTTPFHLTFTTASSSTPDTTPPTIVSVNPLNGSTGFNSSLIPTITFSEPMDPNSFTISNITAFLTANNQQIEYPILSMTTDQQTLQIQNLNLVPSTNYQINIVGGITGPTDLAGNHLVSSSFFTFSTAAPPGNLIYSVTGNNYDSMNASNGYIDEGIFMNSSRSKLVGTVPFFWTFIVKRVGSPTGTVFFKWQRTNDGINYFDFRVLGSIAASSILTTDDLISINDSTNASQIQRDDYIGIFYNGGDSSNYILIRNSNNDVFDGSNTCVGKTDYRNNSNVYTTVDLAGSITVNN